MPQVLWHVVIDLCGQRWKRGSNAGNVFPGKLGRFFSVDEDIPSHGYVGIFLRGFSVDEDIPSHGYVGIFLRGCLPKQKKGETFLLTVCHTFFPPNGAIGLTDLQVVPKTFLHSDSQ